jgi:hypothetical protein
MMTYFVVFKDFSKCNASFYVFFNEILREIEIHILDLTAVVPTTLLFPGVSSRAELVETHSRPQSHFHSVIR